VIVEKEDLKWLVLIAVLTFAVYANALGGDFVYDDHRQILLNSLIQDPSLYGKALTSDVWAFKGDGTVAASNYYRPTFVAWMIGNYAGFGANPFGWHLLNLLLHIGVCFLVFAITRKLDLPVLLSLILTLIFAVHPVHVENVSWISGSSDLLFSLFLIGSILFLWQYRSVGCLRSFIAALILYVLALGSKEVAMLCCPIFYIILLKSDAVEVNSRTRKEALKKTLPFAAAAVLFFVARWLVLGSIANEVPDAPSLSEAILSVPMTFIFYVRQAFFPYFLAENYPLRPVLAVDQYFFVDLVISVGLLAALGLASRRSHIRSFGLALFILPLAPALFIKSFPSEQVVHDRYLYLPLLGLLIICGSLVTDRTSRIGERSRVAVAVLAMIAVAFLGFKTVTYNRVWSSDLALWTYNAAADPSSSVTFAYFAAELSRYGKNGESVKAFDRSLEIKPSAVALMGRARVLMALGRYDETERDLEQVIALPDEDVNAYTLFQAYEAQAIAFSQTGQLEAAERLIRDAIRRLPTFRAALTDKLAIVLYNSGRKQEAYDELSSVRDSAKRELLPASKAVFFRLGMLELEMGEQAAATTDLQYFLNTTSTFSSTETDLQRRQAIAALNKLK